MEKIEVLSKGSVRHSMKELIVRDYFHRIFPTMIDIPVSTTHEMVVFSIVSEMDRIEELRSTPREALDSLIKIVIRAVSSLEDNQSIEMAINAAVNDENLNLPETAGDGGQGIIKRVTLEVQKELIKQISGAGLSSILIKDIFNSAQASKFSFDQKFSFSDIIKSVQSVQDLYASYANSASLAEVTAASEKLLVDDLLGAHYHKIYSTLRDHRSPVVKARASYVLDQLLSAANAKPILEYKTNIPGHEIEILDVPDIENLSQASMLNVYFLCLRNVMRMDPTTFTDDQRFEQLVQHFIMNVPSMLPGLPASLTVPEDQLTSALATFTKIFRYEIYLSLSQGNYGTLAHTFSTMISERKYAKADNWDWMLSQTADISSLIFETFLKVANRFRTWALDDNIIKRDTISINTTRQKAIVNFVFSINDNYTFPISIDNPRYLLSPHHLINYGGDDFNAGITVNWHIPTAQLNQRRDWFLREDFARFNIFRQPTISGYDTIAKYDIPHEMLPFAVKLDQIYYYSEVQTPMLPGGDLSASLKGIIPLSKAMDHSSVPDLMYSKGTFVYARDASDLSHLFSLPMSLAVSIFKGPEMYLDLRGSNVMMLVWGSANFPRYEVTESKENSWILPFVAQWPELIRATDESSRLVKNPTSITKVAPLAEGRRKTRTDIVTSVNKKISDPFSTDPLEDGTVTTTTTEDPAAMERPVSESSKAKNDITKFGSKEPGADFKKKKKK